VYEAALAKYPEFYDPREFHESKMLEILHKADKAANKEEVEAVLDEWQDEHCRVLGMIIKYRKSNIS